MILILTRSVNRCFEKNAKFDMTPLLGGTDVVFSSLIHSFSWFVAFSLSLLHHHVFHFLFHISTVCVLWSKMFGPAVKSQGFCDFLSG